MIFGKSTNPSIRTIPDANHPKTKETLQSKTGAVRKRSFQKNTKSEMTLSTPASDKTASSLRRSCMVNFTTTAFWVLLVHFGVGFFHMVSEVPRRATFINNKNNKQPHQCAPTTIPVQDNQWGNQKFERLFHRETIPGISQQASDYGHIVQALWAFDGQLHIAYGDEDSHTAGPIAMHAWDPVEERWVYHGLIPSDEVRIFRPGPNNEVLYAPEIDGHGPEREQASAVHKLECGKETSQWTQVGKPVNGSAHNYDMAVLTTKNNHKLLVTTGARSNRTAYVASTSDQGETWNIEIRKEPDSTASKSIQRIHNIGATQDNLIFVSGHDKKTTKLFAYVGQYSEMEDRVPHWHDIPNLNITRRTDSSRSPFLVPVILQNDMIITSHTHSPPYGRYISSYRIKEDSYELIPDDPWPVIKLSSDSRILSTASSVDTHWDTGTKTKYICSAPDSDPKRLLVLVRDSQSGLYGVFRTDSLKKNPVWKQALLLGPLSHHDHYTAMAFLRNDLYLGTEQGDIYVVREFYKPVTSAAVSA